jgi:hypothetical protein
MIFNDVMAAWFQVPGATVGILASRFLIMMQDSGVVLSPGKEAW